MTDESLRQTDYFLLGNELGRDIHEAIVGKYGADSPFVTRGIFYDEKSGLVKGSKPGYVVAANEFLKGDGMRTVNSYDLQKLIENREPDTRGFLEDLGLVLYSATGKNEYLARDIIGQIKERNGKVDFPTRLNLNELELETDNNAPQGLAFRLTDKTQIVVAQELAQEYPLKKFSKLDQRGIPIFENEGKHTFYAGPPANSGLHVLIRDRDSDLCTWYWDLVDSDASGRVLVCREAARLDKIES